MWNGSRERVNGQTNWTLQSTLTNSHGCCRTTFIIWHSLRTVRVLRAEAVWDWDSFEVMHWFTANEGSCWVSDWVSRWTYKCFSEPFTDAFIAIGTDSAGYRSSARLHPGFSCRICTFSFIAMHGHVRVLRGRQNDLHFYARFQRTEQKMMAIFVASPKKNTYANGLQRKRAYFNQDARF